MRLCEVKIQGYRSIMETNFDIEQMKTILVGPNEAGKTAVLQVIQKLNAPKGTEIFNPLRDYPRSKYTADIERKKIDPANYIIVEGVFYLEDKDKSEIPEEYHNVKYCYGRNLDNSTCHLLMGEFPQLFYKDIEKDLERLIIHLDKNAELTKTEGMIIKKPSDVFKDITIEKSDKISVEDTKKLIRFLKDTLKFVNEGGDEDKRRDLILEKLNIPTQNEKVLNHCKSLLPKFVLFSNYHRIKPRMNLQQLAERTEKGNFDDKEYDYGNNCLLKYLGFTARELSDLGVKKNGETNEAYYDRLDQRNYRLNSASVELSNVIKEIWNPNLDKQEANKLIIKADGQYLKVVVEDDLGVEVELDQRSEGFQWMVSFFIVFFAEAQDKHKNAILLLDEPGMSLHGLKQAEFRKTLSKLSDNNQTIYTTHSPFLVGANELDKVRVVEMTDRNVGTKVHTTVTASDAASLLPLQEALGYDLAQNLFINERNLILEGLTDYWYLEGISELLQVNGKEFLNDKIALIPANAASKVVYFAMILHAQNLKVVALLDSDAAGDLAAKQDVLVNVLGNKNILRTKDTYKGLVIKCEIEDLLRETLVYVAKIIGWDVADKAKQQSKRPIVDILSEETGFSKNKLAKAFLNWVRDNDLTAMPEVELNQCEKLIKNINNALK